MKIKQMHINPYQAVSIPKEYLDAIKEYCKQNHYATVAEFVRDAIRDKLNGRKNE